MTLDEAIQHCYEDAKKESSCSTEDKTPCANEHLQLAYWLEELKGRRSNGKGCKAKSLL